MVSETIRHRPPYLLIFLGAFLFCLCTIRYQTYISTPEWTHLVTLESFSSGKVLNLKSSPGPLDASPVGAKIVPNKPPGFISLLLPFHLALEWVMGWVNPADYYRPLLWVTCACVGLSATLGFMFFLRLGLPPLPSFISALGIVFCTDLVLYAPMLMRHSVVALLVLMAVASPVISLGRSGFSPLLAGLCLGLCPVFDYSAVVIAGTLALGLGLIHLQRYGSKALTVFTVGLAIPLMCLLFYNKYVYGGFLSTGYSPGVFVETPEVHWNAWYDVFLAQPLHGFVASLFSPSRGLIVLCPPLLVGLWGLIKEKNAKWTHLEKVALAAALCHLIFISSFRYWHGGNFPGHRYLIPLAILLIPTWTRVLGPLLKKPSMVISLWLTAGLAFVYRVFLVWTWSEPASKTLWDGATGGLSAPLFNFRSLVQAALALPRDPLLGTGAFETSKFIFLTLGLVFLGLAWLRTSFLAGEAVYSSAVNRPRTKPHLRNHRF